MPLGNVERAKTQFLRWSQIEMIHFLKACLVGLHFRSFGFFIAWGFLAWGDDNRRLILSLHNSLKSLKHCLPSVWQQKPSGDLPRCWWCPSIQPPLCFVFFASTDLAAGRLQEDPRCWFSFFAEENASNSDEGCSSRRWVQGKNGDYQGFQSLDLLYGPKPQAQEHILESVQWTVMRLRDFNICLVRKGRLSCLWLFSLTELPVAVQSGEGWEGILLMFANI